MPRLVAPLLHPVAVAPLITVQVEHHGSRLCPMLTVKRERIAFDKHLSTRRADLEFVMRAFAHVWQEHLPNPAPEQLPHRMKAAIPAIEIADYADPLRVRCPYGKS